MLMLRTVSLLQTFAHVLRAKNSDLSACHRKLFRWMSRLCKDVETATDTNFVKLNHGTWFSLTVCFLASRVQVGKSCVYQESEVL